MSHIIRTAQQHCGVPLGGLGTGSVEIRADGRLHEWQIMNNAPWGAGPEFDAPDDATLFALHVRGDGIDRTALLALPGGFSLQMNDPYHLPWLEAPRAIEAAMRPPFANLEYRFNDLPVRVTLEAFSPFIPLEADDSALPLAFFTFRVHNLTEQHLTASLVCAQRNVAGYTHATQPSTMRVVSAGRHTAVVMGREGMPDNDPARGTMALGAFAAVGETSYALHPRAVRDIWDPVRATGKLEDRDFGAFEGKVGDEAPEARAVDVRQGLPQAVLCRTFEMKRGYTADVTFALAWHFPEMWERDRCACGGPNRIGHYYENRFDDAHAVLAYGEEHFARLHRRSLDFVEAVHDTTWPEWLLDAVTAQLTTLVKSSWWDKAARFGIWEGLGCCGLQTTDITHYASFPIALFFPEVQKSQMRLTVSNIETRGKVPHMMPGSFACCDADPKERIDLVPQFILLVWRDVLWTGDRDYAAEMLPVVRDALDYYTVYDTDGDGLPNNRGPDQTYDQFPLKGTSAFVGLLYGAALGAAADLERFRGHGAEADALRERFDHAMATLDAQLWNGAYYRLSHDPAGGEDNEGVMADQANADWFVRQTTGRPLLPPEKVRSALKAVLAHCLTDRGYLVNCAWPDGGGVAIRRTTSDQANCPWSGVEFAVAAHCILAGLTEEGLGLTRDVWQRHENAGLRFNHIECGQHYYRALSSWAVYLALAGFSLDARAGELAFRLPGDGERFVVNTPTCWATIAREGDTVVLTVQAGELTLRRLRLRGAEGTVSSGIPAACEPTEDGLLLTFEEPQSLDTGASLRLQV